MTFQRFLIRRGTTAGCLLAFLTLAAVSTSQTRTTADLALGTWELDVEASTFSPGPAPKSQTRTYRAHLDGIEATIETVSASGDKATIRYVADYDSLEYPLAGSSTVSAIQLERVNERTAVATLRHGRKSIGNAKREISRDGKTMTITFKARTQDGRPIENVSVHRKVTR